MYFSWPFLVFYLTLLNLSSNQVVFATTTNQWAGSIFEPSDASPNGKAVEDGPQGRPVHEGIDTGTMEGRHQRLLRRSSSTHQDRELQTDIEAASFWGGPGSIGWTPPGDSTTTWGQRLKERMRKFFCKIFGIIPGLRKINMCLVD